MSLYESDAVPSGYTCASSLPCSRKPFGFGETNEFSQSIRGGPCSFECKKQGDAIAGEGARRCAWAGIGTEWWVMVGVFDMSGGPSMVTEVPLSLVPFVDACVAVLP